MTDPVAHLHAKVKQLELEAQKRVELEQAGIAHNEATIKSFATRVIATAVAWVTSDTVYNIFVTFINDDAHLKTPTKLHNRDAFLVRMGYAIACMICCPLALYSLRPVSGNTKGFSFSADFLKLVDGCTPMILGWSIMDMLVALMTWAGNGGWDELITAVVLTMFLAVLECMPCYKTATAGVAAGGDGDTILNRYCTLPSACCLAVGRMWNEFMTWPIGEIQSLVGGKPNLIFFVQVVYWMIITSAIIKITAAWSEKQASLERQIGEEDKYHLSDMEMHAKDMERTMGQVFVSCLSFVYAWSLNSTLNDFWFVLMCGCSSAGSCGYPTNCAYAVVLTVIFTFTTASMQFQDRREPWGKAHQSLQIMAMSLCVGWAWKGYFNTTITAMDKEMSQGKVVCFVCLFFLMWSLGGLWWHSFLKDKRRRQRQRLEDFKKTKVGTEEETMTSQI